MEIFGISSHTDCRKCTVVECVPKTAFFSHTWDGVRKRRGKNITASIIPLNMTRNVTISPSHIALSAAPSRLCRSRLSLDTSSPCSHSCTLLTYPAWRRTRWLQHWHLFHTRSTNITVFWLTQSSPPCLCNFHFSVSTVLKLGIDAAAHLLSVKTQLGFKANYISLGGNLFSTYNVVYYYFTLQTKLARSSSECLNLSGTEVSRGRERENIRIGTWLWQFLFV